MESIGTLDCIDIAASYSVEDLENAIKHAMAEKHAGTLKLTNPAIKHDSTSHDSPLIKEPAIDLVVFSQEDEDGTRMTLSKVSRGTWSCDSSLDVSPYSFELTVVLQSECQGDIGCINIPLETLNYFREHIEPNTHLIEFVEIEEGEKLKVTFDVEATASDINAARIEMASILATLFRQRFDRTQRMEDLNAAINSHIKLSNATPLEADEHPDILNNMALLLIERFKRTRDRSDIGRAIAVQERGIDLSSDDEPSQAFRHSALGNAYFGRYEVSRLDADAENGISHFRQATWLAPSEVGLLYNLGMSLRSRYLETRLSSDIAEAEEVHRKAVALAEVTGDRLALTLDALAFTLFARFQGSGNQGDLEESVSNFRTAVALAEETDPLLSSILSNFGAALQSLYERGGQLSDLEECIATIQRAILLAHHGDQAIPVLYNNLGIAMQMHFERSESHSNLEEAIIAGRNAVELTVEGDPEMPSRLHNLAISLLTRFPETNDVKDLEEAITHQHRAVDLTPAGHRMAGARLISLSNSLRELFNQNGSISTINESIGLGNAALDLAGTSSKDYSTVAFDLALSHRARFGFTTDPEDIEGAAKLLRMVVECTDSEDAKLAGRLLAFGGTLLDQFNLTPDTDLLLEAKDVLERATTSSTSLPARLFEASQMWVKTCELLGDPKSSILAHDASIRIMTLLAGLDQTMDLRHKGLKGGVSEACLTAAVCGFATERVDKALEWLEQGRCLVWSQLNNLRTPLDELRAHSGTLADRVLSVSQALEKAGSRSGAVEGGIGAALETKVTWQYETLGHVQLAKEWEELLETVRSNEGFDDFLKPLSCSTLLDNLPEDGPVVVINVHKDRCDAIALLSGCDEPIHIPLPSFTFDQANRLNNELQLNLMKGGARSVGQEGDPEVEVLGEDSEPARALKRLRPAFVQEGISTILAELWTSLVKPILDTLGFCPSDSPGRIWWCPTGPLSFLPIHAAGIYGTSGSHATVADYAVSSYTPTVTSLTSMIKSRGTIDNDATGMLVVGQTDTAGLPSIPGTAKEVAIIQEQLSKHDIRTLTLAGERARSDITVQAMENHSCIHFACHAEQNASNPLQSGFHLHDGKLELATIVKKNLKSADFAFLSACQTSTGDSQLSEEAVHLAGGMIAAGYRGVVATMWSIPDFLRPKARR